MFTDSQKNSLSFLPLGKGSASSKSEIESEMPERIAIVNVPTLIIPGIGNSDQAHWQTLWESADPGFMRVQQRNWNNPVCDEWVYALEKAVKKIGASPILVAHSLGCLCVAHWAARTSLKIKGAFLVAPPNPDDDGFPSEARGFSPGAFRFVWIS